MHTWSLLITAALGLQDTPAQADLAIVHVDVVDVMIGELVPDQTILIAGDRIAWVGPAADVRMPQGTEVVLGEGRFLIPGLWDMHVHLQYAWDAEVSLPMFLAHGVTGVRDMASDVQEPNQGFSGLPDLLAWRERIERGELAGPRLLALSTWPVAADGQLGGDAEALVDGFVERGAEFIKVLQGLSMEAYFDLIFAAEERGLAVAGHVPLAVGMIEASKAGQISIEHARDFLFDGFPGGAQWRAVTKTQNPPTEVLRRMVDEHDPSLVRQVAEILAENATRYCPTHVTRRFDAFADDLAFLDDSRRAYVPALRWDSWALDAGNVVARDPSVEGRAVLMDFYRLGLEDTATAVDAGVEVLAGTDANDSYAFPGSGLHDELEELVSAGLTPARALQAATSTGARFLDLTSDHGSIEAGKLADLVLLDGNPLLDVSQTRSIEAVIFDGRLYTRADLDALMQGVEERVEQLDPEVEVSAAALERYVGAYESPRGQLEVFLAQGALNLRFPGRGPMRLRARSETEFVFLANEASVTFQVDDDEAVTGLRFEQDGQGGTARRIE